MTPVTADLMSLDELSGRLRLSNKTLKRLHREEALPLVRFTEGGGWFAFWSEIEDWAKKRPRA